MTGELSKAAGKATGINVIVDADACPREAKEVLTRLRAEYGYTLITVASHHHEIDGPHHIRVGDGPDEADYAVANKTRPGDIVVTQDLGLAALVIERGAHAVTPKGDVIESGRLDFLLQERYLKAKFRRGGGRTKGPKARTTADDVRFERAMRQLLIRADLRGCDEGTP